MVSNIRQQWVATQPLDALVAAAHGLIQPVQRFGRLTQDGVKVGDLRKTIGTMKAMPINIDGALAALLHDLGFPPGAGKLLFIVARVVGLTGEVAEEHAREKPMRIRIPVEYDGEPPIAE